MSITATNAVMETQARIIADALTETGTPAQYAVQYDILVGDRGEMFLDFANIPNVPECWIEEFNGAWAIYAEHKGANPLYQVRSSGRSATRTLIDYVRRHQEQ